MASNDRNSEASRRCLKSIGISLNAALRVHVPRRKIAGPSTAALFIGRGNNCSRLPIFIWANPLEWREPAAACIPCCEANADRMRCDLRRKRGLPVGSGVVENTCRHIVGNRLKKVGIRWSKAGANALLAALCCLENLRWPDFLDWRACCAATT